MPEKDKLKSSNFQKILDQHGIKGTILEFDKSTRSALEAAEAIGCELAQIVKSLIFKTKESNRAILVLTSGVNRVDEKILEELIGEKIGKADADFVRAESGYSIGGVPPFGHANKLPVFIDQDLLDYEIIWAAAGKPNVVFPLSPNELETASGGSVRRIDDGAQQ
jgi:Cys-tRNA(Pro) deacylase